MKRRAQTTPGAEAILAARKAFADEYPWAKPHQVRRLAILSVMRDNFEAQLAAGQNFDLDALLKLDEVIEQARSSIAKQEPIKVTVEFVDSTIKVANIVCKHCGQSGRFEISDKPFDSPTPTADHGNAIAGPSSDAPVPSATADAPPTSDHDLKSPSDPQPVADVVPLVTYRDGVSASKFHSQVIAGREAPPLKREQPSDYRSEAAERERHPYRDAAGGDRSVAHPLPVPHGVIW
jgi:hypothetical protein